MSQITLRNIPQALERELRARAKKSKQSLNRTITGLLSDALGVPATGTKKRDLSDLGGTWTPEQAAEFERAIAVFETIDADVWA
jgi:plasmid stability protein